MTREAWLALLLAGCRFGFDAPARDAPGSSADSTVAQLDAAIDGPSDNDTCPTATTLVVAGGPVTDTTCGADDSFTAACSNGSGDVFFTFQLAPGASTVLALTATFTAIASRDTPCTALVPTCMANGDMFVNTTSTPQTWILALEHNGGSCSGFTIELR